MSKKQAEMKKKSEQKSLSGGLSPPLKRHSLRGGGLNPRRVRTADAPHRASSSRPTVRTKEKIDFNKNIIFWFIEAIVLFFVYVLWIDNYALIINVFFYAFSLFNLIAVIVVKKSTTVKIFQSKNLIYNLNIYNKSIFSLPRIKIYYKYRNLIGNTLTDSIEISLKTKINQEIEIEFKTPFCGKIDIFDFKIRYFDYLKFFYLTKKSKIEEKSMKTPNIFPIEADISNFDIPNESDVYSEYVKGDDPSQIFDLREYQDGDKINRIHWKLTSKYDEIIVKEFSCTIFNDIVLIADIPYENIIDYDIIMQVLFSIAHFFTEKGRTIVFVIGDNVIEIKDDYYYMLRDYLSEKKDYGYLKSIETFSENYQAHQLSHIIYLTANLTQEKYDAFQGFENAYKKSIFTLASFNSSADISFLNFNNLSASFEDFEF